MIKPPKKLKDDSTGDKGNSDENNNEQQAEPTIWETRGSLAEHPLLQTAIDIVLETINHCLSRCC